MFEKEGDNAAAISPMVPEISQQASRYTKFLLRIPPDRAVSKIMGRWSKCNVAPHQMLRHAKNEPNNLKTNTLSRYNMVKPSASDFKSMSQDMMTMAL